jgi:hypothetical protein
MRNSAQLSRRGGSPALASIRQVAGVPSWSIEGAGTTRPTPIGEYFRYRYDTRKLRGDCTMAVNPHSEGPPQVAHATVKSFKGICDASAQSIDKRRPRPDALIPSEQEHRRSGNAAGTAGTAGSDLSCRVSHWRLARLVSRRRGQASLRRLGRHLPDQKPERRRQLGQRLETHPTNPHCRWTGTDRGTDRRRPRASRSGV